jgi:hypothetical protein
MYLVGRVTKKNKIKFVSRFFIDRYSASSYMSDMTRQTGKPYFSVYVELDSETIETVNPEDVNKVFDAFFQITPIVMFE